MFWKILFWIFFILFCGYNAFGAYSLEPQGFLADYTYGQVIFNVILIIWTIFSIGYYFALGWNKRMFPKWIAIFMLVITVLSTIISLLSGFINLVSNFMNGIVQYTPKNLWFGISSIVLIIIGITIPFIAPIIAYLIKYKQLEDIKESLYKIFGIYILVSMLNNFIFFAGHFNLAHKFNFWDYSVIFITTTFEIFVVYLYIFEKKIFTKNIWQTLTCIYVPLVIFSQLLTSGTLKSYTVFGSFPYLINMSISYYVVIRALINYAFGDKIFKDELKIEEKTNE